MESEMNDTTTRIATLAAELGVSAADLRCLAQSAANSIEQDKAAAAFISADAETQAQIALAYGEHAVKKFQSFVAIHRTTTGARQAFSNAVLALNN